MQGKINLYQNPRKSTAPYNQYLLRLNLLTNIHKKSIKGPKTIKTF